MCLSASSANDVEDTATNENSATTNRFIKFLFLLTLKDSSRAGYGNTLQRLSLQWFICGTGRRVADAANDLKTARDLPKNRVFSVEMPHGAKRNEKLTAICVGAAIGHGQKALAVEAVFRCRFIRERLSPHRCSASAGRRRIPALYHKAFDNAGKFGH